MWYGQFDGGTDYQTSTGVIEAAEHDAPIRFEKKFHLGGPQAQFFEICLILKLRLKNRSETTGLSDISFLKILLIF